MKRRISVQFLLVVVLGCLLMGGCTRLFGPRAPRARKPEAVTIPAPPAAHNDVLGAGKIVAPSDDLFKRWGDWLSGIKPELGAGQLSTFLLFTGISINDFPEGSRISYNFLKPADTKGEPVVIGLFPQVAGKGSAKKLAGMMGAEATTEQNGFLIAAQNDDALAKAKAAADTLIKMNQAPMPGDAQAYLNIGAMMAEYGDMMRQNVKQLTDIAAGAMPADKAKNADLLRKIIETEAQAMLDLMEQSEAATFNVGVQMAQQESTLEVSLVGRAKLGSGLAKALSKGPVAAPDLTVFVNPQAPLRMMQSMRDLPEIARLYMHYLEMLLGPEQQTEVQQLEAEMNEAVKSIKELHMAAAMDFGDKGKPVYEAVMVSNDNKAVMRLIREKTLNWANKGPLHDFYEQFGAAITITLDPKTRKVHGRTVYHYNIQVKAGQNVSEEVRKQIEQAYGQMTMEVSRMGQLVLVTLNEPIERLADRVYSGGGKGIEAMRTYPTGGVFYADVNLADLMKNMAAAMPEEQRGQMPKLASGAPPIMMSGYFDQGMAWLRLGVPKSAIKREKPAGK